MPLPSWESFFCDTALALRLNYSNITQPALFNGPVLVLGFLHAPAPATPVTSSTSDHCIIRFVGLVWGEGIGNPQGLDEPWDPCPCRVINEDDQHQEMPQHRFLPPHLKAGHAMYRVPATTCGFDHWQYILPLYQVNKISTSMIAQCKTVHNTVMYFQSYILDSVYLVGFTLITPGGVIYFSLTLLEFLTCCPLGVSQRLTK